MILTRKFSSWLGVLLLACSLPAAAQTTTPMAPMMKTKALTPSQMVSPDILVNRIDLNCGVTRNAIKDELARHLVLKASTWTMVSDTDAIAVDRTHAAVLLADIWKQAGNYAWIHAHTLTQAGAQRATQVCFRNDGTLARVKQATTVPGLDAASARVAYFNTDGSVIKKTTVFEMNDPLIAKKISAEPFYSILP